MAHNPTAKYPWILISGPSTDFVQIQPECQYVYDLEIPRGVIPKPNDSEVQEFYLLTVEEVQEHMANGEFKPNCALLVLDFFIRHGILTAENESNFEEIQRRLHRNLDFPGPHRL